MDESHSEKLKRVEQRRKRLLEHQAFLKQRIKELLLRQEQLKERLEEYERHLPPKDLPSTEDKNGKDSFNN